TSDAWVRDHQGNRGTLPRVLQAERRRHLSGVEGPPAERVPLRERRGTPQDVSDHPRRQGVPAEPPQGDRAALPRLRVRGWSGTGRSVPRVPCDLAAPKAKHERGDPEPGGRAPPDRGRDAREGPADSVEVMAGKIHDR